MGLTTSPGGRPGAGLLLLFLSFRRRPESREAVGSCFFSFHSPAGRPGAARNRLGADAGLVTSSIDPDITAYAVIRVAGGSSWMRQRGQKKVAKEKAAPGSPPLAWCPCAARQARRLWNSLSNLNKHIE